MKHIFNNFTSFINNNKEDKLETGAIKVQYVKSSQLQTISPESVLTAANRSQAQLAVQLVVGNGS